jgi:hypothetical protein
VSQRRSGTHLKKIKGLLQSCLAILEQCAHFTLMEKAPYFVFVLLGLNKGVYLVQCPKWSDQSQIA